MTDTQATTTREELEVLDPASGEVLDLKALDTNDLARAVKRVDEHVVAVADFRRALVEEVVARLDSLAQRKALVGGYELETNPPTTVQYREDVLREGLEELVENGTLPDRRILELVFPTPEPPPPPGPKLNKRELNKLKADPRVAPAIAAASVRVNNNRTLKVAEVEH